MGVQTQSQSAVNHPGFLSYQADMSQESGILGLSTWENT